MKFVVTADWHLRRSVPVCLTMSEDEFFNYQFQIVDEIYNHAINESARAVCIAGDIFDKAVPSIRILNALLDKIRFYQNEHKIQTMLIAGNHDLPGHSLGLVSDSGFGSLLASGLITRESTIVDFFDWGNEKEQSESNSQEIALVHHLCMEKVPEHFEAMTPEDVFKMYPYSRWIVCGDNHHGFLFEKKPDYHLVVPGAITTHSVSLFDEQKRVFLIDTDDDENCRWLPLSDAPEEFLTDKHLAEAEERNERIESFIEKLKTQGKIGMSFPENLERALLDKSIRSEVKKIIHEIESEVQSDR